MLNAAAASGRLKGFVHAYLGMPDRRLPVPMADLIPLEQVRSQPTSFRALAPAALDSLALRGEQLTRVLIDHYCRELTF